MFPHRVYDTFIAALRLYPNNQQTSKPAKPKLPTMVFSLVMMSTLVPTIIGLNEATKGARDQEENRRAESRSRRCHLIATCEGSTESPTQRQQVHNAKVYLDKDYKVRFPYSFGELRTTGC